MIASAVAAEITILQVLLISNCILFSLPHCFPGRPSKTAMRFHEKLLLALAASAVMIIANPIDTQAAEQARVTDNLPRYHTIGASSRFHRRAEREITPKMISKSFGKGPEACDDFLNPSQECQKAIEASMQKDEKDGDNLVGIAGGKLKYAWSSGCEAHYKKIERAAYDAWDLSDTAIEDVSDPDLTPIWNTWMGPDHTDYKGRIIGSWHCYPPFLNISHLCLSLFSITPLRYIV